MADAAASVPLASATPIAVTAPAGLSSAEVAERHSRGLTNAGGERTSRSVAEILRANILTRFNLILGVLLAVILAVGQPQDAHKFTPHVTLARLRHPELDKVREWLMAHALYTSDEFHVGAFCLYSSKLTSDGSIYRVEQEYPLRGFDGEADD